jgi:prepilin-type N-terminal cleavage/methylation domain-containing protein
MERVRARRNDDGFTLIELVLTVAIIGVVTTALTGVIISYLKTTVDTQSRLTESHDVQFAAAYWQRDVASIGVRGWDSTSKTFPLQQSVDVTPTCGLPAGTTVVTLAWSEYTSLDSTVTPTTVTVSYVAQPDGAGYDLFRVRCTGSTVDSTVEVTHSLNALPTKSCDVSCSGSGNNVPTVVELHLSVLDPDGNGTTAYTATLLGERRQT